MKIRTKILMLTIVAMFAVASIVAINASTLMKQAVEDTAYEGMEATVLVVREIYTGMKTSGQDGDVTERIDGIIDSIKSSTGYDVTIFEGDTRAFTTVIKDGQRAVGTKAAPEVISAVLDNGKEFYNDNTTVLDTRYIVYYVPYTSLSGQIEGMIFLGQPYANVLRPITEAQMKLMLVGFIILALGSVVAVFIGGGMARAIKKAQETLAVLSSGQLNVEKNEKLMARKDEVGDMYRNIDTLSTYLKDVVTEIKNQSDALEVTSQNCQSNTKHVADLASHIDKNVEHIAYSAMDQANSTEKAQESVDIIGGVVDETNVRMDEVSDAAKDMGDAAHSVMVTLKKLNESMASAKDAVNLVKEQTNETHKSVQNIGEKANVITGVADQTNLLSLNASIEAARAGEAGRGFAIVASEIQKLAEECNVSAIEIQETLAQLTQNSETSVTTMEKVYEIIVDQEAHLEETNRAFRTVQEGIEKSIASIEKIGAGINKLTEARTNTSAVVKTVAEIAEENAASTEEASTNLDEVTSLLTDISGQTEELMVVAETLKQKIQVFKV